MSQPIGSMISATYGNDGRPGPGDYFMMKKANNLVFDPGFRTLDVYELVNGANGLSKTFPKLGMYNIFERTVEEARRKYGSDLTISGMQNALKRGYFISFNRRTMQSARIPLDEILSRNVEVVLNEALNSLFTSYKDLRHTDNLILTGGTSSVWEKSIREKLQGMESITVLTANRYDPELPTLYSNVRGYYLYASNMLMKRG